MTILTNFDLIVIANQQHEQQNYPHLADAEQVQFEFLGMELLEDDSTVDSYSDDSTIESSEGESDLSLVFDDELWMPLARPGPRREVRRPSLRNRSLSQRRWLERKEEEELEEDSVVLVRRNRVRQSADDVLDEDSLQLSRVPRRKARSKRQQNNEDNQCDNDTANDCENILPFPAV